MTRITDQVPSHYLFFLFLPLSKKILKTRAALKSLRHQMFSLYILFSFPLLGEKTIEAPAALNRITLQLSSL
jgi:hypothetical protein